MVLDLEPIFNNEGLSRDFAFSLDLSSDAVGFESPFNSPLAVNGKVYNRAGIVELSFGCEGVIFTACDRCVKPVEQAFRLNAVHTLVTSVNNEDNDELIVIDGYRFDPSELISEDVFLNAPAKVLCDDDCKGICARCGKDLNEGPCACKKDIDPRLAALQQLLD